VKDRPVTEDGKEAEFEGAKEGPWRAIPF